MWNPIIDKVKDPNGIVCYRNTDNNSVLGFFHVLVNKKNYVGQVTLIDDDKTEIILHVNNFSVYVFK